MLHTLADGWWLVLLRGIGAILFGVLAFAWPGISLLTLVLLYGAYALTDGVFALGAAISGRGGSVPTWWLVVIGLLGIAAGLGTFFWPGITALALLLVIAWWSIVRGIIEIVGAIRLRKVIDNEWLLAAGGALSILFGVLLLRNPGAGALAIVWILAAWAIVFGAITVGLAFRLRGLKHRLEAAPAAIAPRA